MTERRSIRNRGADRQRTDALNDSCRRESEVVQSAVAVSSGSGTRQDSGKHVALFVIALKQGGVGRVILNLAGFFVERGYRVDLLVVRKEGEYLEQMPDGVNLIKLGGRRVVFSIPRLIRYLRTQQPEFLISAVTRANLAVLWARSLARIATTIIVTEHTALSADIPGSNRRRERLLPKLIGRFYPSADAVVAVSKGVADDLASLTGLCRTNIDVIYNPVVSSRLMDMAEVAPSHPWFSDDGPPIILAVGRLTRQKDFPTLIKAFAQLQAFTKARLLILGDGEDRHELETLVGELALDEIVALPGFVDNPFSYLSHADLFVLSSRWEGLPTVLIEAMACGAPVVATDCPSGPAEILENGALGPLTPVGDVRVLASAMAQVLNESPRRNQLLRRAQDFTEQKSALAYENLLLNLSSGGQ